MRKAHYATRRKNSRLPRVQCARGLISPEAISPNFSSFAPMPIALGNIALLYPIPTLGEMALLSATRNYRQREPESPQVRAGQRS